MILNKFSLEVLKQCNVVLSFFDTIKNTAVIWLILHNWVTLYINLTVLMFIESYICNIICIVGVSICTITTYTRGNIRHNYWPETTSLLNKHVHRRTGPTLIKNSFPCTYYCHVTIKHWLPTVNTPIILQI